MYKRKRNTASSSRNTESHDLGLSTLDEPLHKLNRQDGATSQFLIDGTVPTQPRPQLLARKTEAARNGPGRHRSADLKGLLMGLIDETYPHLVCSTCLYTASVRSEAETHFRTEHYGQKIFTCIHAQCDQTYSSKPGLRYHLEHAHRVTSISENTTKRFDRSTSTSTIECKRLKRGLLPYLQKKFDEICNPTICPVCKEQFRRKTHVIQHLANIHHVQEPYKCIISNCKHKKTYSTREGLVYHLISYHASSSNSSSSSQ